MGARGAEIETGSSHRELLARWQNGRGVSHYRDRSVVRVEARASANSRPFVTK